MTGALNDPVVSGADSIIAPSDTSLHQQYIFYLRATLLGGYEQYFGSYTLNVGCISGQVTFTNDPSLATTGTLLAGSTQYTFAIPTSSLTWCTLATNEIVQVGGAAWVDPVTLAG